MTKIKPLLFFNKKIFLSLLLILSIIIGLFSIILPVKADALTEITQLEDVDYLRSFDTNIGTTASLNGMDCFAVGTRVMFYSGNSATLLYNFTIPKPSVYDGYETYSTRIRQFNETFLLVITTNMWGSGANFASTIQSYLINTNDFTNTTYALDSSITGTTFGNEDSFLVHNSLIFYINGIDYVFQNYVTTRSGAGIDYFNSYLFSVTPNTITKVAEWIDSSHTSITSGNYPVENVTNMLSRNSFWILSQEELNTVYLFGASQGNNEESIRILKLNVITPELTFISDLDVNLYGNGEFIWYVDYAYYNMTYDVLFLHTDVSIPRQIDIYYLRFNSTSFINSYGSTYNDFLAFGNQVHVLSVIPSNLIWGNPLNPTLFDSVYGVSPRLSILYVGKLGYVYQQAFYCHNLNTDTPTFEFPLTSGMLSQFRNGAFNVLIFSASNNVGGFLSPYGYGNAFLVDYQHYKVCADYQISTNPNTALYLSWDITPLFSQKSSILPQTIGSFALSQNHTYIITAFLYVGGVVQTEGVYNVWTSGEIASLQNPTFTTQLKSNSGIISSQITFNVKYDSLMSKTGKYEAYRVNVTALSGITYMFTLHITWNFETVTGITLPDDYENILPPSLTPTPNPSNINNVIPIITQIFGNIKLDIVFVIFGIVCSLLTWKFALTGLIAGIGISTFLCAMAGLLDIWAVGLCVVTDITIIVLGSGLLNKRGNDKGNT